MLEKKDTSPGMTNELMLTILANPYSVPTHRFPIFESAFPLCPLLLFLCDLCVDDSDLEI
jgi:hypothetical protein